MDLLTNSENVDQLHEKIQALQKELTLVQEENIKLKVQRIESSHAGTKDAEVVARIIKGLDSIIKIPLHRCTTLDECIAFILRMLSEQRRERIELKSTVATLNTRLRDCEKIIFDENDRFKILEAQLPAKDQQIQELRHTLGQKESELLKLTNMAQLPENLKTLLHHALKEWKSCWVWQKNQVFLHLLRNLLKLLRTSTN